MFEVFFLNQYSSGSFDERVETFDRKTNNLVNRKYRVERVSEMEGKKYFELIRTLTTTNRILEKNVYDYKWSISLLCEFCFLRPLRYRSIYVWTLNKQQNHVLTRYLDGSRACSGNLIRPRYIYRFANLNTTKLMYTFFLYLHYSRNVYNIQL